MIMTKVFHFYSFFISKFYFCLEAQVYEILDEVGDDFEYEDVQKLLEKFEYDNEKIIQYLRKNKGFPHKFS